jgi:hypothetical protein
MAIQDLRAIHIYPAPDICRQVSFLYGAKVLDRHKNCALVKTIRTLRQHPKIIAHEKIPFVAVFQNCDGKIPQNWSDISNGSDITLKPFLGKSGGNFHIYVTHKITSSKKFIAATCAYLHGQPMGFEYSSTSIHMKHRFGFLVFPPLTCCMSES